MEGNLSQLQVHGLKTERLTYEAQRRLALATMVRPFEILSGFRVSPPRVCWGIVYCSYTMLYIYKPLPFYRSVLFLSLLFCSNRYELKHENGESPHSSASDPHIVILHNQVLMTRPVQSLLARLCLRDQIPVLRSQDLAGTAEMICTIVQDRANAIR